MATTRGTQVLEDCVLVLKHSQLVELEQTKAVAQVKAEGARVQARAQQDTLSGPRRAGDGGVVEPGAQPDVPGAVQMKGVRIGNRAGGIRPLHQHRKVHARRLEQGAGERILDQPVRPARLHRPRGRESKRGDPRPVGDIPAGSLRHRPGSLPPRPGFGRIRGDQPQLALADPDDVAEIQLPAAASLRLPVHQHRL